MSKIMQNLIVLMDTVHSVKHASDISVKASNMCLNTFCIDEDAAFEISGVHSLLSEAEQWRRYKVKGYLRLQSTLQVCFDFFIFVNDRHYPMLYP